MQEQDALEKFRNACLQKQTMAPKVDYTEEYTVEWNIDRHSE